MSYFGRFVSSVKGFYSEINSATLTGALDVIVVQQEDGSFVGSPFHVRFGKLGVLRSREKIVDIEINGEPVELQMKLGDAGEAFFVEEVEEPEKVPPEYATSPIPSSINLDENKETDAEKTADQEEEGGKENEINKNVGSSSFDQHEVEQPVSDLGLLAVDEESNKIESKRKLFNESEEQDRKSENQDLNSDNEPENEAIKSVRVENIGSDSDTELLGSLKKLENETGEPREIESVTLQSTHTDQSATTDIQNLLESIKEPVEPDRTSEKSRSRENLLEIDGTLASPLASPSASPSKQHPNSAKSESIPIPIGRQRNLQDPQSDSDSTWIDSASPPDNYRNFNFLSDLDTPIGSPPTDTPEFTRPSSPQRWMSDSEVEVTQSKENLKWENEMTWAWGKLPKSPEINASQAMKPNDSARRDKYNHGYKRNELKQSILAKAHLVKKEGIYLDDLTTVDQEIAALYLHQALRGSSNIQQTGNDSAEDKESGIGPSLPSSPCSNAEEVLRETSEPYHDFAISLCGNLRSGKVPLETFSSSIITFEDLCSNPSLLSDPKLVVRINGRYYNWQIAAPMLLSHVVFQMPLKKETVKALEKQHMPRKEKRRGYYWFWRANNYDEKTSDEEEEDLKKDKPRPRPGGNLKRQQSQSGEDKDIDRAAASEVKRKGQEEEEEDKNKRYRNLSECTSGNESDFYPSAKSEKFKKVTRLNSEQLALLNLKPGANSVYFSVTTKYQGTAACWATIYLWNHSDRVVVSDIDGTITKSDVLGQILPVVGANWAQSGVANFFSAIERNGYKLLYLSARAIGQAQITRDYLKSVKQDQITLPDGPLLLSPTSLIKAFQKEIIEKKPEEFKIACLRDIQKLFPSNPFHSGFGNRVNDALTYRTVGISGSRIFTINHKGEVKHELTSTFQSSYCKLHDLVDQMFPPYKKTKNLVNPDEFSSFTYWRAPLPEISIDEITDLEGKIEQDVAASSA